MCSVVARLRWEAGVRPGPGPICVSISPESSERRTSHVCCAIPGLCIVSVMYIISVMFTGYAISVPCMYEMKIQQNQLFIFTCWEDTWKMANPWGAYYFISFLKDTLYFRLSSLSEHLKNSERHIIDIFCTRMDLGLALGELGTGGGFGDRACRFCKVISCTNYMVQNLLIQQSSRAFIVIILLILIYIVWWIQ